MHDCLEEQVECGDGERLVARLFTPRGKPRAVVLIVPAMGVTQQYYAPLAAWLAEQGMVAATFDYRGMGLSRRGGLRGFQADILDWARLDCAAMLDTLGARYPEQPLFWLGHSLGGQILGLVPNHRRLAGAVTVAAGSGYWRENAAPLRWIVWWLWYVVVPVTLPLCGYFPGRRLRKVGDLPRGVMAQWRRWCLNPEYSVGAEGRPVRESYAALRLPITAFAFTDDEFMSARGVESLHGFYRNAPLEMQRIAPEDIGVKRIGHFGFFRERFAASLWLERLLPVLENGVCRE